MNTQQFQHLLIAYTATATGEDALTLGIALARTTGAHLHLVTVIPEDNAYARVYPSDRGHLPIIRQQVRGWLEEAQASLPEDISSSIHTVHDSSDASGLLAAAQQLNASAMILGGRSGGLLKRFRLGSTANTLLHSSPIPVILAPAGYKNRQALTRVTTMFGQRPGAAAVIARSLGLAETYRLPLRLVSLVFLDRDAQGPSPSPDETPAQELIDQVEEFGNEQLATQAATLVAANQASTLVSAAKTLGEAVEQLTWRDDEIVVFGSSRLASANRTFLGSTASRILRSVAAPMMVIPAPSP